MSIETSRGFDVQALYILSAYGYIEQVDELHILIIFKPQGDTF